MNFLLRSLSLSALLVTLCFGGCSSLSTLPGMGGGTAGNNPLPFPVAIGGQQAHRISPWSYAAKVDQPVSRSARIKASDTGGERVIVNVFTSTADGTQLSNDPAAVYLGNNVALSNPFRGGISKSGYYLANVVVPSKGTSRVVFQVK